MLVPNYDRSVVGQNSRLYYHSATYGSPPKYFLDPSPGACRPRRLPRTKTDLMNFIVFILFVLVCGHLASESASEILKTKTVFIGRKYQGQIDMKNDGNDKIFIAEKFPYDNGLKYWVLKEDENIFGFSSPTDVTKGAPVFYIYPDLQRHSMYRENGTFILEHLNRESHSSNKTIGTKCCVFLNDYSFHNSKDGKLVVSFSRRWLSVVTKYAITMEAGSDTKENFATFLQFFVLQHGDDGFVAS
ncbi:hypothetical protein Ddc_13159 [Ditylenchus destructor]|nr:hypothetical protein Ddc_13159 [Ditylenchus destructor]